MKASLPVFLAAVVAVAVGCSSSTPKSPAAGNRQSDRLQADLGLKQPESKAPETGDEEDAPSTFVDPQTGKKLMRIPKSRIYYVKDGLLYNAIVNLPGTPYVREDDKAYYVEVVPEKPAGPKPANEAENLKPILEIPASEAELVTPKNSKESFRFEEISEGLPKAGIWRENFALGDVLGQGRPQIVAPPPRLTGQYVRVFRLDKDDKGTWRWRSAQVEFDNPDGIDAAYGVAAVADVDGDGKLDIVFGGHGSGPAVALNRGDGKFLVQAVAVQVPDGDRLRACVELQSLDDALALHLPVRVAVIDRDPLPVDLSGRARRRALEVGRERRGAPMVGARRRSGLRPVRLDDIRSDEAKFLGLRVELIERRRAADVPACRGVERQPVFRHHRRDRVSEARAFEALVDLAEVVALVQEGPDVVAAEVRALLLWLAPAVGPLARIRDREEVHATVAVQVDRVEGAQG
ncbi:MAG: hypothetical protein ACXVH0_04295, partial [Thermoanaerobaculia bacterium]